MILTNSFSHYSFKHETRYLVFIKFGTVEIKRFFSLIIFNIRRDISSLAMMKSKKAIHNLNRNWDILCLYVRGIAENKRDISFSFFDNFKQETKYFVFDNFRTVENKEYIVLSLIILTGTKYLVFDNLGTTEKNRGISFPHSIFFSYFVIWKQLKVSEISRLLTDEF